MSRRSTDERRIRLRIGINLGDIIAEDGDIFGDGVNVAARLEALAEPGGICVSSTVRDQIRDKLHYPFEDRASRMSRISRALYVSMHCGPKPSLICQHGACDRGASPQTHYPSRNGGGRCSVTSSPASGWWLWPGAETLPTARCRARQPPVSIGAAGRRAAPVDRRAAFYQSQ